MDPHAAIQNSASMRCACVWERENVLSIFTNRWRHSSRQSLIPHGLAREEKEKKKKNSSKIQSMILWRCSPQLLWNHARNKKLIKSFKSETKTWRRAHIACAHTTHRRWKSEKKSRGISYTWLDSVVAHPIRQNSNGWKSRDIYIYIYLFRLSPHSKRKLTHPNETKILCDIWHTFKWHRQWCEREPKISTDLNRSQLNEQQQRWRRRRRCHQLLYRKKLNLFCVPHSGQKHTRRTYNIHDENGRHSMIGIGENAVGGNDNVNKKGN